MLGQFLGQNRGDSQPKNSVESCPVQAPRRALATPSRAVHPLKAAAAAPEIEIVETDIDAAMKSAPQGQRQTDCFVSTASALCQSARD